MRQTLRGLVVVFGLLGVVAPAAAERRGFTLPIPLGPDAGPVGVMLRYGTGGKPEFQFGQALPGGLFYTKSFGPAKQGGAFVPGTPRAGGFALPAGETYYFLPTY